MMTTVLGALWLAGLLAGGQGLSLDKVELKVPGRVTTVVPADVDGDQWLDLLVFWRQGYPPRSVTRVSVFANTEGVVATQAGQVFSLPAGTVAFDVGDSDQDGRADILLLRADGVFALAGQAKGQFDVRPRPVVRVMTVAAFPHEDSIPRQRLWLELDKKVGMLIPTVPIGPLSLYTRNQGAWVLAQVLRVPTRMILHTAAEDFRASRDYSARFQFSYPRWSLHDQNGDQRTDLFFFCRESVAVFRARPNGSFAGKPDLYRQFQLLDASERVKRGVLIRAQAGDVNGDGRADLVFNKTVGGITNMRSELRLYLAQAGGSYSRQPDFISRRQGWDSSVQLVDVNGDGRKDLVRPHVDVGLTTLVGMMLAGRLEVNFGIHFSSAGKFRERADLKLPSKLGINFRSAQELTGSYPNFQIDFDQDGIGDLVLGQADRGAGSKPDRLEIRRGLGAGKFADDPFFQLNLSGTRYLLAYQQNAQARPGLVLYFSLIESLAGDVWVLLPKKQ